MTASIPRPRVSIAALVLAMLALGAPVSGHAQMAGVPVLQNAFTNPGITVAANYGQSGRVVGYGGAVAFAPSGGTFQLSAGLGRVTAAAGPGATSYGVRAALPLARFAGRGRIGVAPFVGAGGASRRGVSELRVPAGIAFGWRGMLGASRGFSLHAAPFYGWTRTRADSTTVTTGRLRIGLGLDLSVTRSIGLTIGVETGQRASPRDPNRSETVFGAGIAYARR